MPPKLLNLENLFPNLTMAFQIFTKIPATVTRTEPVLRLDVGRTGRRSAKRALIVEYFGVKFQTYKMLNQTSSNILYKAQKKDHQHIVCTKN